MNRRIRVGSFGDPCVYLTSIHEYIGSDVILYTQEATSVNKIDFLLYIDMFTKTSRPQSINLNPPKYSQSPTPQQGPPL